MNETVPRGREAGQEEKVPAVAEARGRTAVAAGWPWASWS